MRNEKPCLPKRQYINDIFIQVHQDSRLKLLWTKYEVGKAEPVLTLEIHDLQQLLL